VNALSIALIVAAFGSIVRWVASPPVPLHPRLRMLTYVFVEFVALAGLAYGLFHAVSGLDAALGSRGGWTTVGLTSGVVLLFLAATALSSHVVYPLFYRIDSDATARFADVHQDAAGVVIYESEDPNAYATGLLSPKILVATSLLRDMSDAGARAIIRHETEHHILGHLTRTFVYHVVLLWVGVSVAMVLQDAFLADPGNGASLSGGLLHAGIAAVSVAPGLFFFYRQLRAHEFEADAFASQTMGVDDYADALHELGAISADGRMETGGPTHPSLAERIKALRSEGISAQPDLRS